jgi:hypothetical protein
VFWRVVTGGKEIRGRIRHTVTTSPPVRDSTSSALEYDDPNPAGNALITVLIATVLVVAAIAGYVILNEHPPLATGEIVHLTAFPVHTTMQLGAGVPGSPGGTDVNDQVILLAEVRIHNQSKVPLFIHDMWANVVLPDQERRSLAASTLDYPKVFVVYPQLNPMKTDPVLRDTTIEPGQSVDGTLIFNYPVSKADWDQRKSLDVTISFLHQKNLTMRAPQ